MINLDEPSNILEMTELLDDMNVPTADSTDNIVIRDVVGNKTDAAVSTVGTTNSIIAYIKGIFPFFVAPSADSTDNVNSRDVVGNKTDAAVSTVGTTNSIMGYLKGILNIANLIQPNSSQNISTIEAELDVILDLARSGQSATTTMDGSELTLYEESNSTPYIFNGGSIDFTGLNAGAGEDTTIKAYKKIKSGGTYRLFYEETFLASAVPDPAIVTIPRSINTQLDNVNIQNVYGIKITATQAAIGAGWNDLDHEWFDSKSGG